MLLVRQSSQSDSYRHNATFLAPRDSSHLFRSAPWFVLLYIDFEKWQESVLLRDPTGQLRTTPPCRHPEFVGAGANGDTQPHPLPSLIPDQMSYPVTLAQTLTNSVFQQVRAMEPEAPWAERRGSVIQVHREKNDELHAPTPRFAQNLSPVFWWARKVILQGFQASSIEATGTLTSFHYRLAEATLVDDHNCVWRVKRNQPPIGPNNPPDEIEFVIRQTLVSKVGYPNPNKSIHRRLKIIPKQKSLITTRMIFRSIR